MFITSWFEKCAQHKFIAPNVAVMTLETLVTVSMVFHVIVVAMMSVKQNPLCLNIAIKLMSLILKKRLLIWQSMVAVSEIQVGFWASTKKQ